MPESTSITGNLRSLISERLFPLQENFTEKLVIVGLDAEHCVYSAIRAALNRKYDVAVIPNGIIAGEEEVKIRMLREYRKLGVEIL